jgi:glycosyltransferase involved in cell wall biosynthesis
MLRNLLAQLFTQSAPSARAVPTEHLRFEAGAVVFVANIDQPARLLPGAEPYSDLASLRLRTFPLAREMALTRPVYLVPPSSLEDPALLDAMHSVEALVIAKFATADLIKHPAWFETLLEWLPKAHGRIRLIADQSDNYAGYNANLRTPLMERYQRTLGEHCLMTVPCEALRQELAPYARQGIQVIEDPYESLQERSVRMALRDPLRLCWFGVLGHSNKVAEWLEQAAEGLEGRAAELAIVAHPMAGAAVAEIGSKLSASHPMLTTRFVPWSPAATWQAIDDCDLVLIPQDHRDPWGRVKSHNRLVESIRGGRLAVASPIPSYLELARYAWVGEDLAEGVRWALAHPDVAVERIAAGQRHVAERFSPQRIVTQWKRLLGEPPASSVVPSARAPDVRSSPGIKLNLGCGDKILAGYVNVDVAPSRAGKQPDVLCDLRKLEPFASGTIEEVLAVHVVEHFWRWEVVDILKEWARVLQSGGRMVLECPNLLTACEEFLRNSESGSGPGPEGQRTMWVFYGDPAWKDPLMCHRWNYTPQSLGAVMAEAGLVNIRQEPAQFKLREPRDMRMVGQKPLP